MKSTGRPGLSLLALSMALAACVAAPGSGLASCPAGEKERSKTVVLKPKRLPAEDEALVLRVSVGALPDQARIVVRTAEGKIAGTISPFGLPPRRKAGVFRIAIGRKALADGKVPLRFEVVEKGSKAPRPPTERELEKAELEIIPITPLGDKSPK
jgi:hypothetical protein